MKRFISLFALLFLLTALPADAQPDWRHQVYFNAGPQFVTGDFSDAYKTGLAIDVGYYYRATRSSFIGVAGGLHQFAGDASGFGDLDVIPINLAFKYNFSLTGIQPYAGAEAGPYFVSNGDSETNFGLAPRIGLRVPLAEGIDLDLNLKYNVVFQDPENFTYVGANGGFSYILQ
jgi:hypothetical protein